MLPPTPFGGTGVELRASFLLGWHFAAWAPTPFCSGYFGARVSLFAQASLDSDPPVLYFALSSGWQACTTTLSFFPFTWRGSHKLFSPGLPWNHDPPNSDSWVACDVRHEPRAPSWVLLFTHAHSLPLCWNVHITSCNYQCVGSLPSCYLFSLSQLLFVPLPSSFQYFFSIPH
jgi:hypothetical protein